MSVTDPVGKALAAAATMWSPKENSIQSFSAIFLKRLNWVQHEQRRVSEQQLRTKTSFSRACLGNSTSELEKSIFKGIVEGQKEQVKSN